MLGFLPWLGHSHGHKHVSLSFLTGQTCFICSLAGGEYSAVLWDSKEVEHRPYQLQTQLRMLGHLKPVSLYTVKSSSGPYAKGGPPAAHWGSQWENKD